MLCEQCGKTEAVVHVTGFVNKQKFVKHLCQACANKILASNNLSENFSQPNFNSLFMQGLGFEPFKLNEFNFDLNQLFDFVVETDSTLPFDGFFDNLIEQNQGNDRCSICNASYEDYERTGRLGCSGCYQQFMSRLRPIIKDLHGSNQHIGKKKLMHNDEPKKFDAKKVEAQKSEQVDLAKSGGKALQGKNEIKADVCKKKSLEKTCLTLDSIAVMEKNSQKYYEKLALEKQMEQLVDVENFEEAVVVRDKIKALDAELQGVINQNRQ